MPVERIYRDVGINDSSNLDSFSKLRISEPSNYDFFDFTYCNSPQWSSNVFSSPYSALNFFTHFTGSDIIGAFSEVSTGIKFIDNKLVFKALGILTQATPAFASIQTRRLINITRNSTIKAYISFKVEYVAQGFREFWIGIGNLNGSNNEDAKSGFIGLTQDNLAITATNPLGLRFSIVLTTGSTAIQPFINKDDWEDRFDGTGPSGIVLDFTKIQVLSIEYRSGGHGELEFGFIVGGNYYRAVALYNVNSFLVDGLGATIQGTTSSILKPILNSCRLTAGFIRTGGTALTPNEVYLTLYGGVIFREDDKNAIQPKQVYNFSTVHNFGGSISSGATRLILRLRKLNSFGGMLTTYFTYASINSINFISTATVPIYWELIYAQVLSGTFTAVASNSLIAVDKIVSGTVIRPNGPTIFGGFIAAGENVSYKLPESIKNMWQLVDGVEGSGAASNYTYFAICITPIGGGTTANQIRVTLTTEETYN